MKAKIIGRLTAAALVIVMAGNAFILVRIWMLTQTDSFYREKKAVYILPEGFTPAKTKVSWGESLPAPSGWVVRYASSGCIYCMLDFEWERLVSQLELHNYRTILILPKETDQFDEDRIIPENAQQMAYVRIDWVKQFRFTGTPTLVIFNNNGRVLWHNRGMLNEADYKSAKKAVLRNVKG